MPRTTVLLTAVAGLKSGALWNHPVFRRAARESAAPLEEDLHTAMNIDLWLKMVKKVEFQPIDRLLLSAVAHEGAKRTALCNPVFVDCAFVVPGW